MIDRPHCNYLICMRFCNHYKFTFLVIVARNAYCAHTFALKFAIPSKNDIVLKAKNTQVIEAVAITALYPQRPSYTSSTSPSGKIKTPAKKNMFDF